MCYEETTSAEFPIRESLITIKMGFTDSSHRKIRDGRTDSGDRSPFLGNTRRGREPLSAQFARTHPLHIPRDSSCIILLLALLGAIIISLGTRGQEYGPNNVGIIRYINNSYIVSPQKIHFRVIYKNICTIKK